MRCVLLLLASLASPKLKYDQIVMIGRFCCTIKGKYVVQRAPSFFVRSCTGPIGFMVETDDHGTSPKGFERCMRSSMVASEFGSFDLSFNNLSSILIT